MSRDCYVQKIKFAKKSKTKNSQSDVLKKFLIRQLKHQIDGPAFIAIGVATAAVISATDRCHAAEWFAHGSRIAITSGSRRLMT
jgi:hypothetical protein